jgi:hypothetical protein
MRRASVETVDHRGANVAKQLTSSACIKAIQASIDAISVMLAYLRFVSSGCLDRQSQRCFPKLCGVRRV